MAIFTNQATLVYNGNTITSNVTTGELREVLSATKTAVMDTYEANGTVTYILSISNAGTSAFTGMTVTDDLGGYPFGEGTVYPLTLQSGSLKYYINGILQPAPSYTEGPPLTVTGVNVPAGGNTTIVYEAAVNSFAPTSLESTITNSAVVSGGGLTTPITVTETVAAQAGTNLTITKALCPEVVTENGQLTYTFVIQNTGNTPVVVSDQVVVSDTFDPAITITNVEFNENPWAVTTNYTYDETTGEFATVAGQVTVPAATYVQDTQTGQWITQPGVSVLTITGTI